MDTFCCSDIHFIWFSFSQFIYLFLHYAILKKIYWPISCLSWSWWWPSHCCWRWNISNNRGIHQQMEVFPLLKCIISKIQWQTNVFYHGNEWDDQSINANATNWIIFKLIYFHVFISIFNFQFFSYSCLKILIIFFIDFRFFF
jgi:hypothetical protein